MLSCVFFFSFFFIVWWWLFIAWRQSEQAHRRIFCYCNDRCLAFVVSLVEWPDFAHGSIGHFMDYLSQLVQAVSKFWKTLKGILWAFFHWKMLFSTACIKREVWQMILGFAWIPAWNLLNLVSEFIVKTCLVQNGFLVWQRMNLRITCYRLFLSIVNVSHNNVTQDNKSCLWPYNMSEQ